MKIKDPSGRPVNNLRLSVTQQCNLQCFYCHREGEDYFAEKEIRLEELDRVVKVAVSLGIDHVKLTGGEPLLRRDIIEIVRKLSNIPHLREVAITTNGILLKGLAESLKEAGLKRINISLGSLNPDTFQMITGVDAVNHVLMGIKEAVRVGLSPIKANMVLLKGINDDQIGSMIDFARKNGLILQLIEFESPNQNTEFYKRHHLDLGEVEMKLRKNAVTTIVRKMQKRKKYFLNGGVEVEVVQPMHNTAFCMNCSRLRVTSDGKFKPCLFRTDNLVDFLTPMRKGATDEEIKSLFIEAVNRRTPYFR